MNGRVKYFSKEKGFGFITSEDNIDYFYHVSDVKDFNLVEYGDYVEFTPTSNSKGNKAIEIKVIQKGQDQNYHRNIHIHHTYEKRETSPEMRAYYLRLSRG